MTTGQKLKNIFSGLVMIAMAIILMCFPQDGYDLVVALLALSMACSGLGFLIYYFTMARFMVGGRLTLYQGLILFDAGLFAASLSDIPRIYLILYLVLIHAFSGVIEILRTVEVIRQGSRSWKLKLAHGITDLFMALLCIYFIHSLTTAVVIYSLGIFYSGGMRIISACRKNVIFGELPK